MGSSKDRRRRILADRTLQGRLIFSLIWPVGLCLAVTAALIGVFCSELSAQAEEAGVVLEGVMSLAWTVLAFMAVTAGMILYGSVKLSLRVAGPIQRLRATLRAARSGDLRVRAALRQGDFLDPVSSEVNALLEWMEQHQQKRMEDSSSESAVGPRCSTVGADSVASSHDR